MRTSEWIRYQDGLWIPYRKRTYLYWFKFLQEAERFDEVKVDWRKYRGWGGANVILGQKFDHWWSDRWKDLFGSEVRWTDPSKIKFPLSTTRPKTDGIRMSLLVWQLRNTPPETDDKEITSGAMEGVSRSVKRRGSNATAIGKKLWDGETGIEKRNTYSKHTLKVREYGDSKSGYSGSEEQVQQYVSRFKRRARKTINNVCEGRFP